MLNTKTIRQDKVGCFLVSTIQLPDGWYEVAVFPMGRQRTNYRNPIYMKCFKEKEEAMTAHRVQGRKVVRQNRRLSG